MTEEEYILKKELYRSYVKNSRKLFWELLKFKAWYVFKHEETKLIKLGGIILTCAILLQVFIFNREEPKVIINIPGVTEVVYVPSEPKNGHKAFLKKMAKLESGDRYEIISKIGYLGKYQIGRTALDDIGIGGISSEDFVNMPELQEIAMKMLLKKNKKYLQSYIKRYNSKTIAGVTIDESGLLAAAHLTGAGSVMQFLDSNGETDPVDGNGVTTSSRIQAFYGYKLDLN